MSRPRERLQLVWRHVASAEAARSPPARAAVGQPQKNSDTAATRVCRVCGPQDLTASASLKTLQPDDIAFFKEHGFLIKKGLLDPVKVEAAMSKVWDVLEGKALPVVPAISLENHQHSVSPGISRTDPASWIGASVNHDGKHGGGLRSLGHLEWMRELVPYDTNVRAIATAMLGPLRENRRVRGVYPIFPSSNEHLKHGAKPGSDPDDHIGQPGLSADLLGPHNDGQVCQVSTGIFRQLRALPIPRHRLVTARAFRFDSARSLMRWLTLRMSLRARVVRHSGRVLISSCTHSVSHQCETARILRIRLTGILTGSEKSAV